MKMFAFSCNLFQNLVLQNNPSNDNVLVINFFLKSHREGLLGHMASNHQSHFSLHERIYGI